MSRTTHSVFVSENSIAVGISGFQRTLSFQQSREEKRDIVYLLHCFHLSREHLTVNVTNETESIWYCILLRKLL